MKKFFILLLSAFLAVCYAFSNSSTQEQTMNSKIISLTINNQVFNLQLENNQTAQSFIQLLPLELIMSDHLHNEKYASLPQSLPNHDKTAGQIHIGDVMLYQGNTLVIFYESFNSNYRYTKIGKITQTDNLKNTLGQGNVTVMIHLE